MTLEDTYRRYYPYAMAIGLRLTRNVDDAHDVVSAVFERLARDPEKFAALNTDIRRYWAFCVNREWTDVRRKRAVRPPASGADAAFISVADEEHEEPDFGPLDAAMNRLDTEDRDLLAVRYLCGLKGREACRRMGWEYDPHLLHRRLERAKKNLVAEMNT